MVVVVVVVECACNVSVAVETRPGVPREVQVRQRGGSIWFNIFIYPYLG